MSNAFVCLVGMGTVFVGLICIIGLCKLMSIICSFMPKSKNGAPKAPQSQSPAPIANKQEIVAAVCAAIAEENGTDVENIRVVSFKKAWINFRLN